MEATVSDILRARMREPSGLGSTAAMSVVAHVAVLVTIVLVPVLWPVEKKTPPIVMTISLGGTPGPKSGGMTTIGGRSIQAAATTVAPKIERMALPSPKAAPAMVLPDPKLKPRPAAKSTPTPDESGRAGGRGATSQPGSTNVETGVRGMGFGLSTSGGGGTTGYLDVKDFCCPEYLTDMINRIRSNWVEQQQSAGSVLMKFTIVRSGEITDIETERSSNLFALDQASRRALVLTNKLQPLPTAFPDDRLPVHLTFEYQRK